MQNAVDDRSEDADQDGGPNQNADKNVSFESNIVPKIESQVTQRETEAEEDEHYGGPDVGGQNGEDQAQQGKAPSRGGVGRGPLTTHESQKVLATDVDDL